jgi:hypothetical protein
MFKSFTIKRCPPINLHKHNQQNLEHAKVVTNVKTKNNNLIRVCKNNKVNDITYQKSTNLLWGLQKKKHIMQISIENGKSRWLFYI